MPNETAIDSTRPQLPIAATPALTAGSVIDGRYEVLSVIGQGGCGCVYKVRQVVMKRVLALKTLNPSTSRMTMLRMQKEAQALSILDHPNIVQATDFGMIDDDQPFFAMEYVDGPTLAQHLQKVGRISIEEMLEILLPICLALSYAQSKGVVHRDIKPSNIILARKAEASDKFIPKLVDFGIAKLQYGDDGAAQLTRTGDIFGTPLYMSPEQCMGASVDQRSDIYSLGCVMFEALTGSPPFPGSNPLEIMMQHSSSPVPSLKEASLGTDFPRAIEQIIGNMLAKNPANRYQGCERLLTDILEFQQGKTDVASTAMQGARPANKTKSFMLGAAVGAVVLLLAMALALYSGLFRQEKNPGRGAFSTPDAVGSVTKPSGLQSFIEGEKTFVINGPSFFSEQKENQVVYTFPPVVIGSLKYWETPVLKKKVTATETVSVPRNAKVTLFTAEPLLANPVLWNKFRPDDLWGIRMDMGQAMTREKFDDAVDSVLQMAREHRKGGLQSVFSEAKKMEPNALQDNDLKRQNLKAVMSFDQLHLLGLLFADFNPRTWLHMGTMPNLRWIWLDRCRLDGKKLRGEDMVQLSNLKNLRVLSIDKLEAPAVMLKQLDHSDELRRLSLGVVPITREDLGLIAAIPHLDSLRLRELKIVGDASFAQLEKAPHLERLALDEVSLPNPAMLSQLKRLKNLKELIVDFEPGSKEFAAIKTCAGCIVQSRPRAHCTWFDWTEENPDLTGLW